MCGKPEAVLSQKQAELFWSRSQQVVSSKELQNTKLSIVENRWKHLYTNFSWELSFQSGALHLFSRFIWDKLINSFVSIFICNEEFMICLREMRRKFLIIKIAWLELIWNCWNLVVFLTSTARQFRGELWNIKWKHPVIQELHIPCIMYYELSHFMHIIFWNIVINILFANCLGIVIDS